MGREVRRNRDAADVRRSDLAVKVAQGLALVLLLAAAVSLVMSLPGCVVRGQGWEYPAEKIGEGVTQAQIQAVLDMDRAACEAQVEREPVLYQVMMGAVAVSECLQAKGWRLVP